MCTLFFSEKNLWGTVLKTTTGKLYIWYVARQQMGACSRRVAAAWRTNESNYHLQKKFNAEFN